MDAYLQFATNWTLKGNFVVVFPAKEKWEADDELQTYDIAPFTYRQKLVVNFFFSATHHICESNNVSRIYHHFAWRQLKWNPTLKRNLATSTDIQATNKALESAITFPKLVSQYRDKLTVWTTKHRNIGVKERGDKMVVNSSSAGIIRLIYTTWHLLTPRETY